MKERAAGLLPDFLDAAAELVRLGADGITTNCGFLSIYQRQLSAHVGVPVATSSLMQIPLIANLLPPHRRVGVITISQSTLTAAHLEEIGVDPSVPIVGTDNGREFSRVIINDEERMDVAHAEQDILHAGAALVGAYPDVGAVLLECTNMAPYARALRDHLHLPVFDIYSFMTWFHASLSPRSFGHPGANMPVWRER